LQAIARHHAEATPFSPSVCAFRRGWRGSECRPENARAAGSRCGTKARRLQRSGKRASSGRPLRGRGGRRWRCGRNAEHRGFTPSTATPTGCGRFRTSGGPRRACRCWTAARRRWANSPPPWTRADRRAVQRFGRLAAPRCQMAAVAQQLAARQEEGALLPRARSSSSPTYLVTSPARCSRRDRIRPLVRRWGPDLPVDYKVCGTNASAASRRSAAATGPALQ
jgi:hypothetical protein